MALPPSPVDKLHEDQVMLLDYLAEKKEVSFLATVTDVHRKTLLLGIASYFEHAIQKLMLDFIHARSAGDEAIATILKRKAIDRQYHGYFAWDGNNANAFFALFGPTLSDKWKKEIKASAELDQGVRAFLELGNLRNQLVHLNFVTYSLEKTANEIYQLYEQAMGFVSWLDSSLREAPAPATT